MVKSNSKKEKQKEVVEQEETTDEFVARINKKEYDKRSGTRRRVGQHHR